MLNVDLQKKTSNRLGLIRPRCRCDGLSIYAMPLRIPGFLGSAAGAAALEEILGWILG